ncbi:MAG TPA: type II toxin-antitoxin system VapC family toxin [Burkholderiales bacterium]|nr:type II toxin-antitoxin system VapC family toxin [Burkholderiales bacterium]
MRLVVDASVIVKWLLADREDENDTSTALALLSAFRDGAVSLIQPPHWLAEVAAVLTRLSPATAADDITDLYALGIPAHDTPQAYLTAYDLARELDHHLFDTLYHAVALEEKRALLVTADEHYYRKASACGAIVLLSDWALPKR